MYAPFSSAAIVPPTGWVTVTLAFSAGVTAKVRVRVASSVSVTVSVTSALTVMFPVLVS